MSGILFLGSSDFVMRQGETGPLLCLTYDSKGLTLVLFYSNHCEFCDNLIKKFKQLPHIVNGCQFAMTNVSHHPDIPERSKDTKASITYVPDLILYVNGSPYVRYDGAHEIDAIKNFIIEIYKKIQQINFFPQQTPQTHQLPPPSQPPQQQAHPNSSYSQQRLQEQQQYPSQPSMPPLPPPHQMFGNQNNDPYQPSEQKIQQRENNIPAYTVGNPLVGNKNDKVCYLNFNTAYAN